MIEDSRSAYGRLAALVYDIDKPVGRSFGDVEFYAERLEAAHALDVLEPAVGNGRVLVPLAKAGFRMTGFDNSPSMLDYAHRNCANHAVEATILEASLEEFDLGHRFDAVILPAGSFQLIDTVAGAARFLRRCHSHLRRGGHLMVDLDPATAFLDPEPVVRQWRLRDDSEITLSETIRRCDAAAQLVDYDHRYEHSRRGYLVSAQSEIFRLRWWRPEQLIPIVAASGFGNVVVSGAYLWRRDPRDGESITLSAAAL